MEQEEKFDRTAWLAKIEKLLATAESFDKTGNTEAATNFHNKAEQLMNKYRVQEEELREAGQAGLDPIWHTIRLCDYSSPYRQQYREMFSAALYHAGCRGSSWYDKGELKGEVVGFEIDVRYFELLFLNASLVFSAHLEPAYDPQESEADNIYRLRRAGKTRREIAVMLWGIEVDHSVPAHGKVQKIYEAECAKRGEQPLAGRDSSRKVYKEIYSKQFVDTFRSRLSRARTEAGLADNGGMVLANRAERVAEALYERYPAWRPNPDAEPYEDTRTEAQKKRDEERAHRRMIEELRKWRSPSGRVGAQAGEEAADKVSLRGTTSQGRIGEGE